MNSSPATAGSAIVMPVRRAVPSRTEICDAAERAHYWNVLLSQWQLSPRVKHFPGANPISIERRDLHLLRDEEYLVALKTDGVRYVLLLTMKLKEDEPIAIMVDRKMRMYEVEVWASEDYFRRGSLFDGELVQLDGVQDALEYVVFDVMRCRGESCTSMPYRDRLQVLHNTILVTGSDVNEDDIDMLIADEDRMYVRSDMCVLRASPKRCVPKRLAHTLWAERHRCSHLNDGLILTHNQSGVETGTSGKTYKWKPHHTVDVLINERGHVFANDRRSPKLVPVEAIDGRTVQLECNRLTEVLAARFPCIVECKVCVDGSVVRLVPDRERSDKQSPNTLMVIGATVVNAIENITADELCAVLRAAT
jgi:hypothetical protein